MEDPTTIARRCVDNLVDCHPRGDGMCHGLIVRGEWEHLGGIFGRHIRFE